MVVQREASAPERLVLEQLDRLGLVEGVDYSFQSSRLGGRVEKGGLVIDFLFTNPPDLAISILGVFWHYEQGGQVQGRDLIMREVMAGQGVTVIFIDEDDLNDDAAFYVREALRFVDHSRMTRGL